MQERFAEFARTQPAGRPQGNFHDRPSRFRARPRLTIRTLFLVGTALGGAASAQAQNIVYNGPGDCVLTNTGTISGGPRTVDITVTSGNILLNLATVNVANSGSTQGAGIAASNTGSGTVSVASDLINASGTGTIYGIDARTIGGNILIDSGVMNANNNPNSRGIYAITAGGNITIASVEANGSQRGIFTGANQGVFPNVVTITSGIATAGAGSTGIFALGTSGALAIANSGSVATNGLAAAAINASTQGNVNVAGGTATAANGNAILVNAGGTATVSVASASAGVTVLRVSRPPAAPA